MRPPHLSDREKEGGAHTTQLRIDEPNSPYLHGLCRSARFPVTTSSAVSSTKRPQVHTGERKWACTPHVFIARKSLRRGFDAFYYRALSRSFAPGNPAAKRARIAYEEAGFVALPE